jgi:hypothetical protein
VTERFREANRESYQPLMYKANELEMGSKSRKMNFSSSTTHLSPPEKQVFYK